MADDLTLTVNGTSKSGWTSVRVTRGIERMPSDFDIEQTELFAGDLSSVSAQPGDTCQILLGSDPVITGYIDRVVWSISKGAHTIRVTGRSKSQDLVDCSAEWSGGQISGATALVVAQNLAQPYKIPVSALCDVGKPIPKFNLIFGETGHAIIERVCKFSGLLFYDMPDGSVVLARTGTTKAASGFTEGQNIQAASLTRAMDQEYSEYDVVPLSMAMMNDASAVNGTRSPNAPLAQAFDVNVKPPRRRLKISVCEPGAAGHDLSIQRANWEAARRAGRALKLTLTTDSWRDSGGTLWTPNTIVTVQSPALKLNNVDLCIGEVSFRRDNNGTTADLILMPPKAFLPEPVIILPAIRDAVAAGSNPPR